MTVFTMYVLHIIIPQVKSSLEEQFGKCGEISRMAIPKDFESCASKRVACIDFIDSKAFSKALDLSGYELSGGTIIV
ncbi:putative RNA recognition motif domain, nucleotide-binding alpha-beta plait domain superfamily [Helianthus annuus]|nr:putative RNA recognition motif domain, nucleotide-binding alpha-beta plait domain superfamily [Helianthus annuus]KAJ0880488.1 putative RNA recognition motif domain, nucleotide-binding alpha-beta plait domain superfamily [Helianthus annuus]